MVISETSRHAYWRKLGNAPGLWILLFAGVGLLTLNLGEQKIQKRMLRQYSRASQWMGNARGTTENDSHTESAANPVGQVPPDPQLLDYRYEMNGLRWILFVAAGAGLILLIRSAVVYRITESSQSA